jgi:hypothetical protein
MSKKLQIQIPTPCHENWENMLPVEKGRFCASCQKQVTDFSKMNDREIAVFFKKTSSNSICGKFMQDQINRDIEIPKKRIPWLKYFFQFALPTFMISMRATAQGKVKIVEKEPITTTAICNNRTMGKPSFQISKKEVTPMQLKKRKQLSTISPEIQYPEIKEKNLSISQANISTKNPILPSQSLTGSVGAVFVMLSGEVSVCRRSSKKIFKPVSFMKKILNDTIFNNIKVYPNPVSSNSVLNILAKQLEAGNYILQLYNQSGQLTFEKEIFTEKNEVLKIGLPSVISGNYFLRLTNKRTNAFYTKKIIVQ